MVSFDKAPKRKHALAAAAAIAVAAGYALYGYSPQDPAAPPQPAPVSTAKPQELNFPEGASQLSFIKTETVTSHPEPLLDPLNARIAYDENHTQRVATPIAGRVVRILAQPGDRVTAGQPLLEVDAPEFAQAESDASKSLAELNQKRAAYRRAKELVEGEVAARKELEIADADLKQAQAEHNRAAARLANLTQGVAHAGSRYTIRSRITGVVAERKVNPGAEVRPDLADPLFVVTDPTHLWVIVDLPERLLGAVHTGQKASVEVDAYPKQAFPATVANIGEVVDPATRRIPVRCIADNPQRLLKPEMYARVIPLADSERHLPRVPNSALITEGLYSFVFVEASPGMFRKRRVTPGLQGRNESYIKDGLKEGEKVVTGGALLLNAELAGG
ncbi:MAG: efflux RND transporter periplasmic adaptor subunit [Rhodospirillaceae bacterium]